MSERLAVRKTYKLYVNGAFPRSESGRTYEVTDARAALARKCPLVSVTSYERPDSERGNAPPIASL